MRVTIERLIDGVVDTLHGQVLPDVATPFARGQLYAAIDVLRNLRDRVEARADLIGAESDSAVDALEGAATAAPALAARIRDALRAVPAGPPAARAAALRGALVDTLTTLAALPDGEAMAAARGRLLAHLGSQAMREVAVLKPSMLGEISRG
jgi:hypothetical protein